MNNEVFLEVKDLKKYFKLEKGKVLHAVDNVSFKINKGETLGLVGESGCGKTTCGRTVIGLYEKSGGDIIFEGKKINNLTTKERKEFSRVAQMIFQDPYASLNPRMKVQDIVEEPLLIRGHMSAQDRKDKVLETLELVGLRKEHSQRFPHEFSGGQRQRIGIARALITDPECIICDEPISALDVSIQVQIVTLLERLQEEKNVSYVFISHDLYMVRYLSQRIAVMYLGHVVEEGRAEEIYTRPLHPYTMGLIAAVGKVEPRAPIEVLLQGELPSPLHPPKGCPFSTRCLVKTPRCEVEAPRLQEVEGRKVACFLVEEGKV